MNRVPSGFLPPLRRVAQKEDDGRRYPWSPKPRLLTEDVTVVADDLSWPMSGTSSSSLPLGH